MAQTDEDRKAAELDAAKKRRRRKRKLSLLLAGWMAAQEQEAP